MPDTLYPELTFVSTAGRSTGDGAEVAGNLTSRGMTRPATLQARIYRQDGFKPGDVSHLSIPLTGTAHNASLRRRARDLAQGPLQGLALDQTAARRVERCVSSQPSQAVRACPTKVDAGFIGGSGNGSAGKVRQRG